MYGKGPFDVVPKV